MFVVLFYFYFCYIVVAFLFLNFALLTGPFFFFLYYAINNISTWYLIYIQIPSIAHPYFALTYRLFD